MNFSAMGILGQQSLNARVSEAFVHKIHEAVDFWGVMDTCAWLEIDRATLKRLRDGRLVRLATLKRVKIKLQEVWGDA